MFVRRTREGVITLNTRYLALIGASLFTLGIAISANAEPNLKTDILSDKLQRQDSGRILALSHSQDQTSYLAFPDKGQRGFNVSLGHRQSFEHLYGQSDTGRTPNVQNPEPAPMLLLGSGLVGLASVIRRKRRRSR